MSVGGCVAVWGDCEVVGVMRGTWRWLGESGVKEGYEEESGNEDEHVEGLEIIYIYICGNKNIKLNKSF